MDKILLALDAVNIDSSAVDFSCMLAKLTHSELTGIFLDNLVENERVVLKHVGGVSYPEWEVDTESEEYKFKQDLIKRQIALFSDACKKASVGFSIHRDGGVPAKEIISESRYADIVITDAATSFNKKYDTIPTGFVKDILKEAECPVIIAPENPERIDEIVFAYDGSKSSAFAIRQFTYVLPEFKDKKAVVLQINEDVWAVEERQHFVEWLQNHYSSLRFENLKGDVDDKLFDYLFLKSNIFLVLGAYGRNAISRFFRKSEADKLVRVIACPIFIAHY